MTTIHFVTLHDLAVPPRYAHDGDAGADLITTQDCILEPGQRALLPTGLALAIPMGFVGLVHPRSGLAVERGLGIVNAPGTIDAGYRGEVRVCVINLDPRTPIELRAGDRIAQLLVQRVERATFVQVDRLDDTGRSTAGFGSTGVSP